MTKLNEIYLRYLWSKLTEAMQLRVISINRYSVRTWAICLLQRFSPIQLGETPKDGRFQAISCIMCEIKSLKPSSKTGCTTVGRDQKEKHMLTSTCQSMHRLYDNRTNRRVMFHRETVSQVSFTLDCNYLWKGSSYPKGESPDKVE